MRWMMLVFFLGLASEGFAGPLDEVSYSADAPASHIQPKPGPRKFLEELPEDLEIKAELGTDSPIVGQVRFGSSDSVRIAFVVDQPGDATDDFDLYVDADRDRVIRADEKVDGAGRTRELMLDCQIISGDKVENLARKVRFRRSRDPILFSLATLGGYLSKCNIGDREVSVWRVDGNGNGLFSDRNDEFWVDANADGKWGPIAERHLYRPALVVDEVRYAVRGDERGNRIGFEPIVGEGELRVDVALEGDAELKTFAASVYGDDGSSHSIGKDRKITLPVGKYTLGKVAVVAAAGDEKWTYYFSHSGRPSQQKWFEVTVDGEVAVPVMSGLELDFKHPENAATGGLVKLQPSLTTNDGLYLTSCSWGNADQPSRRTEGGFELLDASGKSVATATSGFA